MSRDKSSIDELKQNIDGSITTDQTRRLYFQFFWSIITFGLAGIALALGINNILLRTIFLTVTVVYIIFQLVVYGADILQKRPSRVQGRVIKQIRKFKGPTRYEIIVVEHNLLLRVFRKQQWTAIQNESRYEVYFAPKTKWLLSCHQVHRNKE
jgi:hypothetical protein